jgi:hypothetical protein
MTKVPNRRSPSSLALVVVPTQCDHYWSGLRCQLWAGHASAHAARQNGALISWRSDEHGDRIVLDWADQEDEQS